MEMCGASCVFAEPSLQGGELVERLLDERSESHHWRIFRSHGLWHSVHTAEKTRAVAVCRSTTGRLRFTQHRLGGT